VAPGSGGCGRRRLAARGRVYRTAGDAGTSRGQRGGRCGPLDTRGRFGMVVLPPISSRSWGRQASRRCSRSDTTAPPRDASGEIVGVIETLRDITDRRAAEQSIRQGQARPRRAQSIAHVGSWELDLRTQAMRASEEAFRVYGIERSTPALPLDAVQSAVLPEYRQSLDEALRRLIAGQGEYDEQFEIRRALSAPRSSWPSPRTARRRASWAPCRT
jgi:PAS domain-containing protein